MFQLPLTDGPQELWVRVWDWDRIGTNELIGEVYFKLISSSHQALASSSSSSVHLSVHLTKHGKYVLGKDAEKASVSLKCLSANCILKHFHNHLHPHPQHEAAHRHQQHTQHPGEGSVKTAGDVVVDSMAALAAGELPQPKRERSAVNKYPFNAAKTAGDVVAESMQALPARTSHAAWAAMCCDMQRRITALAREGLQPAMNHMDSKLVVIDRVTIHRVLVHVGKVVRALQQGDEAKDKERDADSEPEDLRDREPDNDGDKEEKEAGRIDMSGSGAAPDMSERGGGAGAGAGGGGGAAGVRAEGGGDGGGNANAHAEQGGGTEVGQVKPLFLEFVCMVAEDFRPHAPHAKELLHLTHTHAGGMPPVPERGILLLLYAALLLLYCCFTTALLLLCMPRSCCHSHTHARGMPAVEECEPLCC